MDQKKKQHILIVDDDKFLLNMYAVKFTNAGYTVTGETDSVVTLGKLRDGLAPDIIMVDIVMPGMSGLDLLEEIQKAGLVPSAVRIVLTNQNEPADVDRAERLGVVGYIVKATSVPSEVVSEVERLASSPKKVK